MLLRPLCYLTGYVAHYFGDILSDDGFHSGRSEKPIDEQVLRCQFGGREALASLPVLARKSERRFNGDSALTLLERPVSDHGVNGRPRYPPVELVIVSDEDVAIKDKEFGWKLLRTIGKLRDDRKGPASGKVIAHTFFEHLLVNMIAAGAIYLKSSEK